MKKKHYNNNNKKKNKKIGLTIVVAAVVVIGAIVGITYSSVLEQSSTSAKMTIQSLKDEKFTSSPVLGDSDAPITIVEFGDYQCTFCYRFHRTTLQTIQQDYIETGKVNLIFKDFTINGPDSVLAAEAAQCARDQDKYWEYHDTLYKNWKGEHTGWITGESLQGFANTVGLDIEEFDQCLYERKHQQFVLDTYNEGQLLGIDGTPSFLIFNADKFIKVGGNQPLEVFLKTFEELST